MPGERPALVSGRYPMTADPIDLQRVAVEHARELDRNVDHHKAHSYRLGVLEATRRLDSAVAVMLDDHESHVSLTEMLASVRAQLEAVPCQRQANALHY
ncbi:MAG: hypothetical protein A2Y61_00660 [Chloroflexi bacterium RBG_13_60_13]|nr:MAG: hypothetical protein A2Y61_00660 [Chloroflexi bacterium RBG_13_60_13]